MAVNDGQPVNASVTNAAYISRTQDSDTTAKVGLKNTDAISGSNIENAQRLINEIADVQGNTGEGDATSKDYSSNNVVTNGDNRKVAIGKLDAEFDASTGHTHDGVNSAAINAANLAGHNPYHAAYIGVSVANAVGSSINVTSEFSGKSAGGNDTTEGVLTSAPNNRVKVLETIAAGTQELEDGEGNLVYGKISESGGTWTLDLFVEDGGVETSFGLFAATDITIFFREVFGPNNPKPTITADVANFVSANATLDIANADSATAGKVTTVAQDFGGVKNFVNGATVAGDTVVTETATQNVSNKTFINCETQTPTRLDVKQDTEANLITYAGTATNGQLVFSTDTKKYSGIIDNALADLGGGGAGTLDTFYAENFENFSDTTDLLNSFTFTGSGTAVLETSGAISNTQSFGYTQASGSLGDTIDSPAISLDIKQQNVTLKVRFAAKYDGSDDDINFKIGGAVIPIKNGVNIYEARFFSTASSIQYQLEVVSETIAAQLIFDDVELTTNTVIERSINNVNQYGAFFDGSAGASVSVVTENVAGTFTVSEVSTAVYEIDFSSLNLTVAPTIDAAIVRSVSGGGDRNAVVSVITTTTARINTQVGSTGGQQREDFVISLMKQGADFDGPTNGIISSAELPYNTYAGEFDGSAGVAVSTVKESTPNTFTPTRTSTGVFDIDYTSLSLTVAPIVVASPKNNAGSGRVLTVGNVTTTTATIDVAQNGAGNIDDDFTITLTVDSADFKKVNADLIQTVPRVAYIKQIEVSGVNGGTFTSGSYVTRVLNTIEGDTSFVTLSSNQFTIKGGKTEIEAIAPAAYCNRHKAKIRNISDAVDEIIGSSESSESSGSFDVTSSKVKGVVNYETPKTYELQHRCQTTRSTNGLGAASGFGDSEVYSIIKLTYFG